MRFSVPITMYRSAEIADSIVRWCLTILVALLPFFFFPVSWIATVQAKVFLVALALLIATAAWAWGRYVRRSFSYPARPMLAYAALALPAVYLISALASGRDASSFVSGRGEQDTVAAMVLLFALLILPAAVFGTVNDAVRSFVRSFTVGGLVLVVIQIQHALFPAVTFGVLTSSASSLFGSWQELGILAGLFAFLSLTLFDTPLFEGRWKWPLLALGGLSAFLLLVVNMAGAWFVFGALVIMFGIYQWRSGVTDVRRMLSPQTRVIATLAVGLVAIACGYGGAFIYGHLPSRLQVAQAEVRPSWQGTFAIGKKTLTGTGPVVFGSGPNTFTRQWSLNKPAGVNATDFWDVDFNAGVAFIPTTFVTVGLLGVLAWSWLGVALLWYIVRFVRSKRQGPLRSAHAALLAAALCLAVVHVIYVPSFGLSALTFVLFGLVALIGSDAQPTSVMLRTDTWKGIVRTVFFALVALAVVFAALFTLRATLSDVLVNRSEAVYRKSGDIGRSLGLVQNALSVNPRNDRAHRAAVELGLIRLQQLASQGGTDSASVASLQEALSATIEHGLAAIMIDNGDYQNWLSLAVLYQSLGGAGVKGAYDNAKMALEKTRTDNPTSPIPYLRLSQIAFAEGKTEDAKRYVDESIRLKPNFAAAFFLRSQIEARLQDYAAAAADAEAAAKLSPNESLGWYNLGAILYTAGKFADAAQVLERAVALQADYADALFILGISYERLGRHDDAIAMLTKVLQLNPGDASISQMIAAIRAGQPISTGSATSSAQSDR